MLPTILIDNLAKIIDIFAVLQQKLEEIKQQALQAILAALSSRELYEVKVKFLGKSGLVTALMKDMSSLPATERPQFGKLVNEVKQALEQAYENTENTLKTKELNARLQSEKLDLTLPALKKARGSIHPVTLVIQDIVNIFANLGYSVRTGPLIELDHYNFESLNIPADHPARDMQDTFYIDEKHVLRTQTSPIQVRTMELEKPPLRILGPGSVFRNDSDVSHSPMFHQIEGLCIEQKVSMSDLKGTLNYFVKEFFGKSLKTRLRPSFFPFTEPSAEVDCQCPICAGKGCGMCGQSGWVEVGGCGLVHPNVFKTAGLTYPDWQGFAFGFGIERLAIVKYGVDDIRLFTENDLRFLRQFRV